MSRINDIWQRKPAGLVLGLDFSGGRATSPTGHSGTLVGNAAVAAGTRYLALDGAGDYLQFADAPELSFTAGGGVDLPFSICGWYYPNALQNNYNDLVYKGEYFLRIGPTGTAGRVEMVCQNSTGTAGIGRYTTASVLTAGTWNFLTGVYTGSKTSSGVSIFLNASQVDNANSTFGAYAGMSNTSQAFLIGYNNYSYANGNVAGVRLYNRALTQPEIAQIYNAGAARIALGGTP